MAEAERLHEAICSPLVSPQGDHYKVCLAINEAIARAIVEMTGAYRAGSINLYRAFQYSVNAEAVDRFRGVLRTFNAHA